jgi:hypothetical protein
MASVPTRSSATATVYNNLLQSVISDLNTKLSSKTRVDFLPATGVNSQAALVALFVGKPNWSASLVNENQAGTGSLTIPAVTVTYLVVK